MKLSSPGVRGRGATKLKMSPTTRPGYENSRKQKVVESTGAKSTSRLDQTIYRMRCGMCTHEYGANGIDIHGRCCPACQNGEAGEPLRESHPKFDFGD